MPLTSPLAQHASNLVQSFLRGSDWACDAEILDHGAHFISSLFGTDDGSFRVFIIIGADGGGMHVASSLDEKVPPHLRGVMLEFANKFNEGTGIGCLTIDQKDGEVNFRNDISFEENPGIITPQTVRGLILLNCSIMANVMVAVRKIVFGGMHPAPVLSELIGQQVEPAHMPLSHGAPPALLGATSGPPPLAYPTIPSIPIQGRGLVLPPPPPPPGPGADGGGKCFKCGGATVYLPQHRRHFCNNCSEIQPGPPT